MPTFKASLENLAMIDLFSVVLSSAVSWGVRRLLDATVNCRRCGTAHYRDVENSNTNAFRCHRCNHRLAEYVNATEHTTNRNGAVVGAQIYGTHWPSWRNSFEMYYSLDVVNSAYQEVAVELLLSEFRGEVFHRYEFLRKPTADYTYWTDDWIRVPVSNFPHAAGTVAVDLNVYNVWGDHLDRHRRLMEYGGRR